MVVGGQPAPPTLRLRTSLGVTGCRGRELDPRVAEDEGLDGDGEDEDDEDEDIEASQSESIESSSLDRDSSSE